MPPDGNRDAYRERAETYLRLLAETVLRQPGSDTDGRLAETADLLAEADVLAPSQVMAVLGDYVTALRARGRRDPGWRRPASASREHRDARPERWRVFPGPDPVPGAHVMALVLTPDRVLAPAIINFPPSAGGGDPEAAPWAGLAAADGAGTDYRTTYATGSWTGSTWTGTILLRPAPPPGAGWIKVVIPNGLSLLAPLPDPPPAPSGAPEPVPGSPGERLLTRYAEAILARLPSAGGAPAGPGPSELAATLEAAGALPACSPVPRHVAALAELLGLLPAGLGPGDGVPARWLAVAAHYGRRRRQRPSSRGDGGGTAEGTASIGVSLPDTDGARFAVAGLHRGPVRTHLHVVARGLRPLPRRVSPGFEGDAGFSWWLRDDAGDWHLGVIEEALPAAAETMLRLALLPPLARRTATATVEVTGPGTRVTATLPVRWQGP